MYRKNTLGVADHFQVLKVSFGTCTGKICLGLGDHFQVLKVSEGTCTGKIFSRVGDHFQVLKMLEGTCQRATYGVLPIRFFLKFGISLFEFTLNFDPIHGVCKPLELRDGGQQILPKS